MLLGSLLVVLPAAWASGQVSARLETDESKTRITLDPTLPTPFHVAALADLTVTAA